MVGDQAFYLCEVEGVSFRGCRLLLLLLVPVLVERDKCGINWRVVQYT